MYRFPLFFGAVVLILIVGVFLLFGGHKSAKPKSTSTSQILSLPSYANTDAKVSLTIDGPINGDDAHRAIRISVSQSERDLDVIQGYSGTVISHQPFYNTQDAYAVFLRAINAGGFLSKLANSKYPADERGQCAGGVRYIFELDQGGKTLSRLWASDCSNSTGTLGGNTFFMRDLFQAQITDYNTLTQDIDIGD